MVENEISFYANPDGMSCGQCTYKMILENIYPEKEWSFETMDQFCGAVKGKYTWPYKPILELSKLDADLIIYTNFDTEAFLDKPEEYLIDQLGDEGGTDAIENSSLPTVIADAENYLKLLKSNKISEIRKSFTPEILRKLLDDDYLINVWVDSAKLNNREGYTGHFILVHSYDPHGFYCNDSGGSTSDGQQNRYIKDEHLIKSSSAFENGETGDIVAIRKKHA